mgnify:CR=1 FL=1
MTILLTRPASQSARFADELRSVLAEVDIVAAPLMVPQFLMPMIPARKFAAIVLTSETGAEAARRISAAGVKLPDLAYCVGDRTAFAASGAGFHAVSANGNAANLVGDLVTRGVSGPLLHVRGKDSRGNVVENLNSAGIETFSVIAYDQREQPVSAEMRSVLRGTKPVLVPLFSPRSARMFAEKAMAAGTTAPLMIVALSVAVAKELAPLVPDRIAIAAGPGGAAMIEAIIALINDDSGS